MSKAISWTSREEWGATIRLDQGEYHLAAWRRHGDTAFRWHVERRCWDGTDPVDAGTSRTLANAKRAAEKAARREDRGRARQIAAWEAEDAEPSGE